MRRRWRDNPDIPIYLMFVGAAVLMVVAFYFALSSTHYTIEMFDNERCGQVQKNGSDSRPLGIYCKEQT